MAVNPDNERTAKYLRALAADIEDGLIGIRRLEVYSSFIRREHIGWRSTS